jgi:cobalt/nickel transport system ATP-binding protein
LEEVIKIRNLSFAYPDGKQVLQEINLIIYKGEQVAIIGPNGAGKTTLLLHLVGILKGRGDISILGMQLNNGNIGKIRSKVGLVFQNPDDQLFTSSVFEDVAFGPLNLGYPEDLVKERVKESLKKVGMSGFEKRFPHHLSLGEKKRISIATVLSMDIEILILDEPTSNLDPKTRRELIQLLKNFKITKIIATHDLDLVLKICEKVILLDSGKIVAAGNTQEILSNKSLMEMHNLEVPLQLMKQN